MERQKVFMTTQLLSLLPPTALKVALYICNWQNSPSGIMLYEHRFAKTLKMTDEEIRIAIQTLINLKLIDLESIDNKWKININTSEWQKFIKVPMEKVIEHVGYQLATKVEYDAEKPSESNLEALSDETLEKLLLEIQRRRQQKNKGCEVIYANANNEIDQLPF